MTARLYDGAHGPYLATAAVVRTHRLALGLEVVDVLRGEPADVSVAVEGVQRPSAVPVPTGLAAAAGVYDPGAGLPRLPRGRRPGRFRLLFDEHTTPPVRVRVYDDARRYVPRRLQVPFASLAAVLAEEESGARPAPRARRIAVFPGAAYGPQGNATGVRGRVVDTAGTAVPWVRVAARHPAHGVVLGCAHGDDRGEFLLVLRVPPTPLVAPDAFTIDVLLDLAARPAPPPASPAGLSDDPLAGLLTEVLPAPGGTDGVSGGTTVPASCSVRTTVAASLQLGRLISPDAPFTLPEPE